MWEGEGQPAWITEVVRIAVGSIDDYERDWKTSAVALVSVAADRRCQ